MAVNELLVRRLLADEKIVNFEDSALFRHEVAGQPGAAALLITILTDEGAETAGRAGAMLCQLGPEALGEIGAELTRRGPRAALALLMAAWAITAALDAEGRAAAAETLAGPLAELLNDRTLVAQAQSDHPLEHERDYRLCDEAYALLQFLRDPAFDEELFRTQEDEARDEWIRAAGLRGGGLVA